MRNVLYMAALTAIRLQPRRAGRLRAPPRPRHPAKAALVAAMRKLLTILNAMIRDATPMANRLTRKTVTHSRWPRLSPAAPIATRLLQVEGSEEFFAVVWSAGTPDS